MGGISAVKKAYHDCTTSLRRCPAIFIPFLVFGILETITLIILYLAPRAPLKLVFGPIIKTFWGEAFLHYPANFILLPKLTSLSRMGLAIIFSSLLTGMAVSIVYGLHHKKENSMKEAFKDALGKYASLFIVVLVFSLSCYFLIKLINFVITKYFMAGHSRLLFLPAKLWLGNILLAINFIVTLFIQAAFIYTIPLLVIGKKKLVAAVIASFVLFKKFFIATLILVGMPMLLYLPVVVLTHKTYFLITRVSPESVLWVCFLGTVVGSLIIDPLMTVAATFLYLQNKDAAK